MNRDALQKALDKSGLGMISSDGGALYIHGRDSDNMLPEVERFAAEVAFECFHIVNTSHSQLEAKERIVAMFALDIK